MIKRISLLVSVALMAVMMMAATVSPAFAASSQQECEAAGGEFSRDGGRATCVQDPVITEGKNDKFQKSSQTTETGQGNLDNKEDDTTTTTCTKPCPPGQFK